MPPQAPPTNSAQALSGLQATQAAAQDPNTILSSQREQLGVNNAQNTVTGLRGAINNTTKLLQQVAPSVMGRTGSSLVTNAQATRQIGNEQAPISQKLTEQGTQYNQANQDLGQLQDRATETASGIYKGQQDKLSYAQNLYNTLYKQEQDAADRAEQIRQFNVTQAASNKQFDYGVQQDKATAAATQKAATDKALKMNKDAALKDVKSVLGKSNLPAYKEAVSKSAARGNELDKIKLELLQQLAPQLFNVNSGINPKQTYAPVNTGVGKLYASTF